MSICELCTTDTPCNLVVFLLVIRISCSYLVVNIFLRKICFSAISSEKLLQRPKNLESPALLFDSYRRCGRVLTEVEGVRTTALLIPQALDEK